MTKETTSMVLVLDHDDYLESDIPQLMYRIAKQESATSVFDKKNSRFYRDAILKAIKRQSGEIYRLESSKHVGGILLLSTDRRIKDSPQESIVINDLAIHKDLAGQNAAEKMIARLIQMSGRKEYNDVIMRSHANLPKRNEVYQALNARKKTDTEYFQMTAQGLASLQPGNTNTSKQTVEYGIHPRFVCSGMFQPDAANAKNNGCFAIEVANIKFHGSVKQAYEEIGAELYSFYKNAGAAAIDFSIPADDNGKHRELLEMFGVNGALYRGEPLVMYELPKNSIEKIQKEKGAREFDGVSDQNEPKATSRNHKDLTPEDQQEADRMLKEMENEQEKPARVLTANQRSLLMEVGIGKKPKTPKP